jgi:hypothetical protein
MNLIRTLIRTVAGTVTRTVSRGVSGLRAGVVTPVGGTLTVVVIAVTVAATLVIGDPALAEPAPPAPPTPQDLPTVINNARLWIMGIIAAVATFFLTVGGARYMMAGGDPQEVERAKGSFKSAGIGYALALLAPVILTILNQILGG